MTGSSTTQLPYKNIEPEFVAVVLASSVGARLFPLTSAALPPKHLLPVAGLPLLQRLLESLADFQQIFVAIAAEDTYTVPQLFQESDLWQAAADAAGSDPTSPPTPTASSAATTPIPHSVWTPKDSADVQLPARVTLVRLPEECPGSAEVLRQLEGLLPRQAHTLIVPGDLIVTHPKTTISDLVQAHRQNTSAGGAACTLLLQDVGEQDEQGVPLKESAKAKKGGLARDPEDIEFMALACAADNPRTCQLLWKQGKLAAEQDESFTLTGQTPKLLLPKARLTAPRVKVRSDWNDLHTYLLAPWVVRLVQAKTTLVSLQRDLLPLLIRRQFLGKVETFGQGVEPHRVLEILEEDFVAGDVENSLVANTATAQALSPKDGNNNSPLAAKLMKAKQTYTVLAHVGEGAMRSSSLPAYLYASKDMLQKLVDATVRKQNGLRLPADAKTNPKFVSLALKGADTGTKPTLKASIIGANCRLGIKCRLNNVILMDNVQLGDNVVLQNTIVGPNVVIGDNCSLNDCQVAADMKIESGTKEKGEVLVGALVVG